MRFEWDPDKAALNLEVHNIALADATRIFDGPTLEVSDTRADYGEDRFIATGLMFGKEIVVVYTPRGDDGIRLISARRANRHERQAYWERLGE